MFAIVSHKGNQYKLENNKEFKILLSEEEIAKKKITFPEVLLLCDDKKVSVGQPTVAGASVEADITGIDRTDKVEVFKFHSKKRYKRTLGQRVTLAKAKVLKINQKNEK
jgi:large subunit ribosomal protein L21